MTLLEEANLLKPTAAITPHPVYTGYRRKDDPASLTVNAYITDYGLFEHRNAGKTQESWIWLFEDGYLLDNEDTVGLAEKIAGERPIFRTASRDPEFFMQRITPLRFVYGVRTGDPYMLFQFRFMSDEFHNKSMSVQFSRSRYCQRTLVRVYWKHSSFMYSEWIPADPAMTMEQANLLIKL